MIRLNKILNISNSIEKVVNIPTNQENKNKNKNESENKNENENQNQNLNQNENQNENENENENEIFNLDENLNENQRHNSSDSESNLISGDLVQSESHQRKFPLLKTYNNFGNITRNVVLVGQEFYPQNKNNTFLLVARDTISIDGIEKSYIDILFRETQERRVLYEHSGKFNCVGASLNQDQTILTFTIICDEQNIYEKYLYQTFLVVLNKKSEPKIQPIWNPTTNFQSALFLPRNSKKFDSFIFILDCTFIEVWNVYLQKTKNDEILKTSVASTIANYFIWFEFDTKTKNLFYLQNTKKNQGQILFCTSFNKKEPENILEFPLNIIFQSSANSSEPVLLYDHEYFTTGHISPNWSLKFNMIRISQSGYCFCQQNLQFHDQNTFFINVVLWILHHREQVEIHIPLNNIPEQYISRMRAFFGSLYQLLLIYIPSYFVQFVDCSKIHKTCDSFKFFGSENATPLGDISSNEFIPFNISPISIPRFNSFLKNSFIDNKTGNAYDFRINTEYLYHLDSKNNSETNLIYGLHIAHTHLNDDNRAENMILHLCYQNPKALTSKVFQEYLIGASYRQFQKQRPEKKLQNFFKFLNKVLPVTTILPFQTIQEKMNLRSSKQWDLNIKRFQILKEYQTFQSKLPSNKQFTYMDILEKLRKQACVDEKYDEESQNSCVGPIKNKEASPKQQQFVPFEFGFKTSQTESTQRLVQEAFYSHINSVYLPKSNYHRAKFKALTGLYFQSQYQVVEHIFGVLQIALICSDKALKKSSKNSHEAIHPINDLKFIHDLFKSKEFFESNPFYDHDEIAKTDTFDLDIFDEQFSALADEMETQTLQNSTSKDLRLAMITRESKSKELHFESNSFSNQDFDLSLIIIQQKTAFEVLSQFYFALEELCLPFPMNFHYHFCRLGFLCLSKEQFIQHLDSHIFYLDEQFVDDVLELSKGLSRNFKLKLMNSLNEKSMWNLAEKYPEYHKYLLELYSSQISNSLEKDYLTILKIIEKNITENIYTLEDPPFLDYIPLKMWITGLSTNCKNNHSREIAFLNNFSNLSVKDDTMKDQLF
ncbi:gamma-secretase-activating protein [Anaeramoeba ignava]|uniref:Gamma-secretase-activating protein n=1 Tax=Anaeramoeba ignava TaxID=1746090 RepID=A0A9Q0L8V3_ANAIG|nr:gamma-secretase-activating protein [Anaeramoeba ignava]